MQVLQSIYDGDENFKILGASSMQYKVGEHDEPLSILVDIKWAQDYPDCIPTVTLDSFYNQHLPDKAKKEALMNIVDESWKNVGEQQTYTLIEWMKENLLQLIGPYVFDEVCRLENHENEGAPEATKKEDEDDEKSKKESKKEQMTKAQKRRQWGRMDKDGNVARGHDWVDVVRHLSQTGGSSYTEAAGGGDAAGAAGGIQETSKQSTQ
jgi:hypothetical protein